MLFRSPPTPLARPFTSSHFLLPPLPPIPPTNPPALMFKDFHLRIFQPAHTIYSLYFLTSFLLTCTQVIPRSALLITDAYGAAPALAPLPTPTSSNSNSTLNSTSTPLGRVLPAYPAPIQHNASHALYALLNSGGFERCTNLPGPCVKWSVEEIQERQTANAGEDEDGIALGAFGLCPMLVAYSNNMCVLFMLRVNGGG